jgi:hypothetical protein
LIILFRYNNETYKILDIAWDKDPNLPFTKLDGTQQTLNKYYLEVKLFYIYFYSFLFSFFKKYQITIRDEQQPLIVVKGSRRAAKRGPKKEDQSMIFLIPELCCLTG